ncbi:MAG: response regulator [Pacificimonas sp.]
MTRILVVEDDFLLALDMTDVLEDLGYEIIGPVMNLDAGIKIARSEKMDFALLDVNLGNGLTSAPIAAILRERCVNFTFVTAYTRAQIGYAHDNERILSKPVSHDDLKTELGRVDKRLQP